MLSFFFGGEKLEDRGEERLDGKESISQGPHRTQVPWKQEGGRPDPLLEQVS